MKKSARAKKDISGKQKIIAWFKTSVWVYPTILLILLALLTTFKISGSSVGIYHQMLYGTNVKDPNLLYGKPKLVRADEWQDITQLTIAQSYNNYQKFNPNLGSGRNLALQVEVPYKDWSAVFRPHTWAFFFLGLERGFAFKWWFSMFLLMIGSYFFALRILPGKKLLAVLFSVAVGISPFLLWWYQTAAFGTIAYGFLIIILIHRILNSEKVKYVKSSRASKLLQIAGLAYLLTCFELLLYPPFQIPVAIVVVIYALGAMADSAIPQKNQLNFALKNMGLFGLSILIAGIVGLIFIKTNHTPIHALSQTVYPGKRIASGGNLPLLHLVDGFVMPFQQKGVHLFRNLSESSNFILLLPFLLIPGFVLLAYEYLKKQKIDYTFLAIQLGSSLFLLRGLVHFGQPFYRFLLLDKVPTQRMVIGMGFIGFLQLIYFIKKIDHLPIRLCRYLTIIFGLATLLVLAITYHYLRLHYHAAFGGERFTLLGFAALFSLIIIALLYKKPTLAVLLFFALSVLSGFRVVPLYRGLGDIYHGKLAQTIIRVPRPTSSWITLDNLTYENAGLVAGEKNISGVQIYPDTAFWQQVGGAKFNNVYNREGHILFTTENLPEDMQLVKSNLFKVKFYCSDFILRNVNYALSTKPINYDCTKLLRTIKYPKTTFYIYQVERG